MKERGVSEEVAELMSRVKSIVSYKEVDGDEKPHKGLLLLLVLVRFRDTGSSSFRFSDLEERLRALIASYSTSRRLHAEYPFWSLQNDRLWEVFSEQPLRFRKAKDVAPRAELVRGNAVGKLPFWVERLLSKRPELIEGVSELLLKRYFSRSMHAQIKKAVGLTLAEDSAKTTTTGLI